MCLIKETALQKKVSLCKCLQTALSLPKLEITYTSGERFPPTGDSWSIDIELVIDFVS